MIVNAKEKNKNQKNRQIFPIRVAKKRILANLNMEMILDEKVSGMGMYKLGDLCSDVVDCPHSTPEWKNEGIRVIRNFNIVNGSLDFSNGFFVDEETFEKRTQRACPEFEDLVISREAPMGAVCMIPKNLKCCLGQRLVLLKINKELADSNYILFAIQSQFVQKQIQIIDQTGSIVSNLNIPDLKSLRIPLPSLPEQKKIASVLSALDDKIALNKKMNQKLEAMAKRLYDYWFVQYDFPDKNGHPYKTTGGPMTYNPTLKREIPEGWEVAPISEFIEKNFNGEWGKEEASEDDIRVHCVRGADIVDMVDMPVRYISTKKKDRILNPNDIIVEISGGSPTQSTGRATFVTRNTLNRFDSPMTCSNFCQIIRLKDAKCASYFFEMWQKFYASDIFFNFEGKTSGIKNFQTDSFIATPWAHPPKELMYKFDEMYQSFMKKKERLIAENQKLTALRDKLLPLLMNGQVVVG